MLKKLAYIILLLLGTVPSKAQEYFFKNITVDNGLSHNLVFCTMQDSYGFVWFGTKDGLNRYDGYNLKIFRNNPQNANSIGNNDIRSLLNKSKNEILVGTKSGLFLYDILQERFTVFNKFSNSLISGLLLDDRSNIWVIANHNLYRINGRDTVKMNFPEGTISSICTTSDGKIWVGTTNGEIGNCNFDTYKFTFHNALGKSVATSKWIEEVYDGGNGNILIGTSSWGLLAFDTTSKISRNILSYDHYNRPLYVRDIVKNNDEYWVASESGIYILDEKFSLKKNIYKDPLIANGLSDNAIYSLLKDNMGNIWMGTYFKGVSMYPKQNFSFNSFYPNFQFDNKYSLNEFKNSIVREFNQDKYGNTWIGTEDNGIYKLNSTQQKITHLKSSTNPQSLSYNNIHGLLGSNDTLWAGTFERGLDLLNVNTGKVFKHYDTSSNPTLASNFIITFCKTKDNNIYLGTGKGLQRFNSKINIFESIPKMPTDFIYALIEDHNGLLYVGTEYNNLLLYNPKNGDVKFVNGLIKSGGKIPELKINSIYEDNNYNIWIATEGAGLYVFNPTNKSLQKYNTENGLPSNFVYKVLQDKFSNMWVSSSLGLVFINTQKNIIRVFTKDNGLSSNQFNYNSGFTDKDGYMSFGSTSGIVHFYPDNLKSESFKIPLYFTSLKILNKEVPLNEHNSPLKTSLLNTKTITLNHTQSTFSIDFAALLYASQNDIHYAYKLNGLDKDWVPLQKERTVYFTQLSPGEYELEVKAISNISKKHLPSSIRLNIIIQPPFWKSTWAYIIYTLSGIALLFFSLRYYYRYQKNLQLKKVEEVKRQKELENNQAKIEFFTNIAHEIKTPLTLIQGPVEDLVSRSDNDKPNYELKLIEKNTKRLLELTNQLLDFRRIENGNVHLNISEIDLTKLITEVYDNFKIAAGVKSLQYNVDTPAQKVTIHSDEDALMKILYNLFSNGIKYCNVYFKIILDTNAQSILVHFENDGELIPPDSFEKIFQPFYRFHQSEIKEGSGIGLSIAQSLTTLLGGSLSASVMNDKNIFTLTLPYKI